jgi:hypothetical protein
MKTPMIKKPLRNDQPLLDWKYGEPDTNIILEQKALNVQFLRYEVLSTDGRRLYDTISFKESPNNTVILVRDQKKELGLVWEWRPIPAKWFWACPRGFGDPNDEDNLATAKREMIEEIGKCKVIHSKRVGNLYSNTTFFESPVGLVLLDVEVTQTQISREEGIVDFKFYSKAELLRMIQEDKIEDTFTLSALMRYFALGEN